MMPVNIRRILSYARGSLRSRVTKPISKLRTKVDAHALRGSQGSLDVTRGVIWVQLLQLCFPIFLSSLFQQSHAIINTVIVGHFAGRIALGGIQATTSLCELAIGFCVGVGAGCAVIVGQYFGAHDDEKLSRSVHTAMTLSLIGGLCCSLLGFSFIGSALTIMDTPQDLYLEALHYGQCYFGAMIFSLILNMGSGILRAVGDSRTPSIIVAFSCVVNVALDFVFVGALNMGALGCGIATACALASAAALIVVKLMRIKGAWKLMPSRLGIDPEICLIMIKTGLPMGIQSGVYSTSNIIAQSAINSFGTAAVTGWGLAGRIDGIVWMISEALAVSATAFSAQNFGAHEHKRIKRGLLVANALTIFLVGGMAMILIANIRPIAALIMDDPEVIDFTAEAVCFLAPFYFFYSVSANIAGVIRGTGESLWPMIITIVGTCLFRVFWLILVVPIYHHFSAVLLSYPVTWILTTLLFIAYYRFVPWLEKPRAQRRITMAKTKIESNTTQVQES